jgi:hypothetical protein
MSSRGTVAELVAAYRLSGANRFQPGRFAVVELTDDNRIACEGGDSSLLACLKAHRDEVAAVLRAEKRGCARCGGERLVVAYWGEPLCASCAVSAAAEWDRRGWPQVG